MKIKKNRYCFMWDHEDGMILLKRTYVVKETRIFKYTSNHFFQNANFCLEAFLDD